jgi:hypothetical protein
MLMVASPAAQAAGLLDWLEAHSSKSGSTAKTVPPTDDARLLTLEPGENEMYPKVSPNGKSLLVVSGKQREQVVTRRVLENGDPVNVVSDDSDALDSIAWFGNDRVTFLSSRAGGMGLWDKVVNGNGVLHRIHRLDGRLLQPVALADGSMLAVRLFSADSRKQSGSAKHHEAFMNWEFPKAQPHIVHITADGVESDLTAGVNPAVSPDGTKVVFSMQAGRSMHLFMMRVDGSELVQLTDERSMDVQPAWSPNGKWIVFTSNRSEADMRHPGQGNWDIWAVDIQGRNIAQLTKDEARDGGANVGADGRVYFHSDRKVSKEEAEKHQVKGNNSGFHIWSVPFPEAKKSS